MRCWVAIRHRGFSVSEVFGECKKIELASVLEWVKVVNFSWLTIRCVWITWFSCSLRILFFSVYIIEAILSWTFVWLMCCSKCIWMSVAFSLVFDFDFYGFLDFATFCFDWSSSTVWGWPLQPVLDSDLFYYWNSIYPWFISYLARRFLSDFEVDVGNFMKFHHFLRLFGVVLPRIFRFQCPSRSNVGEFLIGTFSLLFVVGFYHVLPCSVGYWCFYLRQHNAILLLTCHVCFGVCFSFLPFD